MDFLFEIIRSASWHLHTFGIAAVLGFACIINPAFKKKSQARRINRNKWCL